MSDSSTPAPISKHKLAEARRLGFSARSPELTAGVVLLATAWVGSVCWPHLILSFQALLVSGFQTNALMQAESTGEFSPALIRVGRELLRLWASCWAATLLTDLAQVGFVWSPETLLPHEERISPAAGWTRLLSWPTFERASLLSIKLVCGVVVVAVLSDLSIRSVCSGPGFSSGDASLLLSSGASWVSRLLASLGATCLVYGALDAWLRQRRWRVSIEQTADERRRSH